MFARGRMSLSSSLQRSASRAVVASFASAAQQASAAASDAPELVVPADVMMAYQRIKGTVVRSSLAESPALSKLTGCNLFLKNEHSASVTGSYKERGALNKLLQLSAEERARGVICSSAGNHAQAVSHHSTRLGIDGVIVMPTTTPHVKVKKTADFGGRVVLHGDSFATAYEFARQLCDYEGRTFIHAFDDPQIVAGAGTVAIEMIEQNPFLDAIVVPVGGGGLIAGMSLFIKSVNPRIKVRARAHVYPHARSF
jgi:threonine dehydratase